MIGKHACSFSVVVGVFQPRECTTMESANQIDWMDEVIPKKNS